MTGVDLTEAQATRLVQDVTLPAPLTVALACRRCGDLVWDVVLHYAFHHPDIDPTTGEPHA